MSRASGACPFCGLIVIKDDEAQTILHEAPVCTRFSEIMHSGAKPEVTAIPAQDVEKVLDAYVEKVKKERS